MTSPNTLKWFVSAELDAPELKSPQPCPRGIHCDYKIKDASGALVPACCRFVHPGEEGVGRKLFPARTVQGRTDPPCVRLINAPYYERRHKKMSWPAWTAYIKSKPAFQAVTIQPINPPVQSRESAREVMAMHLYNAVKALPEFSENAGQIVGILLESEMAVEEIVMLLSPEGDLPSLCYEVMEAVAATKAMREMDA